MKKEAVPTRQTFTSTKHTKAVPDLATLAQDGPEREFIIACFRLHREGELAEALNAAGVDLDRLPPKVNTLLVADKRKAEIAQLGLESDFSFSSGIDNPPWSDDEPFEALVDSKGDVWLCSLHKVERSSGIEALKWRLRLEDRNDGSSTGDFTGCVKAALREFERLEAFARASYREQVGGNTVSRRLMANAAKTSGKSEFDLFVDSTVQAED